MTSSLFGEHDDCDSDHGLVTPDESMSNDQVPSNVWSSMENGCYRCRTLGIVCVVDVTKGHVVKCDNCRKENNNQNLCRPKYDAAFSQHHAERLMKRRGSKVEGDATKAQKQTKKEHVSHLSSPSTASASSSVGLVESTVTSSSSQPFVAVRTQSNMSTSVENGNDKGDLKIEQKRFNEENVNVAIRTEAQKRKAIRRAKVHLRDLVEEACDPSIVRFLARKVAEELDKTLDE